MHHAEEEAGGPGFEGFDALFVGDDLVVVVDEREDDRIKTALGGQRGLDFVEANVEQLEDAVVFRAGRRDRLPR